MKKEMLSLSLLANGESAVVGSIGLDDKTALRLKEMGFIKGTPLSVVGRSPFGYPFLVEIRGYHICLDEYQCERIIVEKQ